MSEVLHAELKSGIGTGVARKMRAEGHIPAIVYGAGSEKMISINAKEFMKIYTKGGILSKTIIIELNNKKIKVLPRAVQFHPVSDSPLHVDFQELQTGKSVAVSIPVHVTNEDKSPGLKRGGILNVVYRKIHFHCMPENMPAFLDVNVAGKEIGDSIHINDLKLPEGMRAVDKSNFTIVSIAGRVEEDAAPSAEETAKK